MGCIPASVKRLSSAAEGRRWGAEAMHLFSVSEWWSCSYIIGARIPASVNANVQVNTFVAIFALTSASNFRHGELLRSAPDVHDTKGLLLAAMPSQASDGLTSHSVL